MQFTFMQFKLLHNHLVSILKTNNHQKQSLGEKILHYVQMIVQSEKNKINAENVFDYFCQNEGLAIMKLVLEVQPLLSIKCLSLLFINLKNQEFIGFLLCQPFLMNAIEVQPQLQHQQWVQYYISFLKSLSIRVTANQLSLFYNKKFCKFPLIYQAMKYYNHSDCMVRTNVMNIILGLMKIKHARASQYFGSFPFTSYVLTYCSEISHRVTKFNSCLEGNDILKSNVKMYSIDFSDYLCYLNDLITYGSANLSYFIRNALCSYVLIPQLKYLINGHKLCKNTLFTIHAIIKTIRDQELVQKICNLLASKTIPQYINYHLQKNEIYFPKVFAHDFQQNFYWDKFNKEIMEYCLEKFKDIEHFETEYEISRQKIEKNQKLQTEFQQEINAISKFMGFNILTYEQYEQHPPICPRKHIEPQHMQPNKLRQSLISLLDSDDDQTVMSVTSILILLVRNQAISNQSLKSCGLLFPKMDTVNYLDQYNINQLLLMKQKCINQLQKIRQKPIRIATFRNLLLLLDECLFKELSKQQRDKIRQLYHYVINIFKDFIKSDNIIEIVQNFQDQFTKWKFGKDMPNSQNQLPYSIFLREQQVLYDIKPIYLLKVNKKDQIIRHIQMFSLLRSFYKQYLKNFQHKDIFCIEKAFNQKFNYLKETCQTGKMYEIGYRTIVQCKILKPGPTKTKPNLQSVIIVQQKYNLLIVQPSNENHQAKILLNCPWRKVQCKIHRQEGRRITLQINKFQQMTSFNEIYFQDSVTSAGALQWMGNLKRNRYLEQQAFILHTLRQCLLQ